MHVRQKFATAVTLAATLFGAAAARAGDEYSFPSPNGSLIAASTAMFANHPGSEPSLGQMPASTAGAQGTGKISLGIDTIPRLPLPLGGSPSYRDHRDLYAPGLDAASYGILTHALNSASYANYASDYYRLFAPGHAVASWTERAAGIVEVGYGAVDGWTAGTYYLNRLRGPAHRTESAPDLTLMPTFRPHPELEQNPSFSKHGN